MPTPRIIILSEIMRGKTYELTKDVFTIGRTEEQDVCIPDGTVSTLHCEIIKQGEIYIALDKGSTNGTRINGIRISQQNLRNSDILQVGGIEILFDCEDKANTTSITTQTAIDLETSTGAFVSGGLRNIDPTKQGGGLAQDKSRGMFTAIIVVLVLLVLLLAYFFLKQFGLIP